MPRLSVLAPSRQDRGVRDRHGNGEENSSLLRRYRYAISLLVLGSAYFLHHGLYGKLAYTEDHAYQLTPVRIDVEKSSYHHLAQDAIDAGRSRAWQEFFRGQLWHVRKNKEKNSQNRPNPEARFGAVRACRPAFRRSRRVTPISET